MKFDKRIAPEVSEVVDDLRRIVRVLRQSSREAEQRLGVTGAQLFVLRALAGERAVSVNTLASRTLTHQSTVSEVVRRLEERGLVHRAVSSLDRRRTELTLTPRGTALLKRAPGAAQERLIEGIERLARGEREVLAESLHKLVLAMGLGDEPPAMFFSEEQPTNRREASRAARR